MRLTRQLLQLMSPIGAAGQFRATMIHAMNVLRSNTDLLLSTMDVFIKEPLIEWMVGLKHRSSLTVVRMLI
jgi:DNA-dependent protein kinase catalytic subunit